MDYYSIEEEFESSALVHIGARITPELKRALILQAEKLGISLSDLIFQILLKGFSEYKNLEEYEEEIEALKVHMHILIDNHKIELAKQKAEKEEEFKKHKQEQEQRLERFINYVDSLYMFTSKSRREQLRNKFYQPL